MHAAESPFGRPRWRQRARSERGTDEEALSAVVSGMVAGPDGVLRARQSRFYEWLINQARGQWTGVIGEERRRDESMRYREPVD